MPQSLSNVLVHLVFSTKGRRDLLEPQLQEELHPYLAAVARNNGCNPLRVGGVSDHVHLLVALSRTLTIAHLVEHLKTSSSKWLKTKGVADFAWQGGYGAFSVSPDRAPAVVEYIAAQAEHHRRVSFQDEFRALMREAGIEIDERYAWD